MKCNQFALSLFFEYIVYNFFGGCRFAFFSQFLVSVLLLRNFCVVYIYYDIGWFVKACSCIQF